MMRMMTRKMTMTMGTIKMATRMMTWAALAWLLTTTRASPSITANDGGDSVYAGELYQVSWANVNAAITIDMGATIATNKVNAVLIEWGDNEPGQYPLVPARSFLASPSQLKVPISHTYTASGIYTINITYSDVSYTVGGAADGTGFRWMSNSTEVDGKRTQPACIMSTGLPCTTYPMPVQVYPQRTKSCRPSLVLDGTQDAFVSAVNRMQDGDTLLSFRLSIVGAGAYTNTPSSMLTKAFASQGVVMKITISNATNSYDYTFPSSLAKDNTWTMPIPIEILESDSPMIAEVSASSTSVLECSIDTASFDISLPWVGLLRPGPQLQLSNIQLSTQTQIRSIHIVQDDCAKTQALMYFTLNDTVNLNSTGSIVLQNRPLSTILSSTIRSSLFTNYTITQTIPSSMTMCPPSLQNTIACTSALLFDIRTIDDQILILSSRGFYTMGFPHDRQDLSSVQYIPIITGNTDLDNLTKSNTTATIPSTTLQMHLNGHSYCYGAGAVYVLTFNPASNTNIIQYVFASYDVAKTSSWSKPLHPSDIPGLDNSYRFISAYRSTDLNMNVYLLGKPIMSTSAQGIAMNAGCDNSSPYYCDLYNSGIIVLHDTTLSQFKITFRFPNASVVSSLEHHSNYLDMFVYGKDLWTSVDGGLTFRLAFSLATSSQLSSALGNRFVQMCSSEYLSAFALLSDTGAVFYGRVGAMDIVPVRTPHVFLNDSSFTNPSSQKVAEAISMDDIGMLSLHTILPGTMNLTTTSIPYRSLIATSDFAQSTLDVRRAVLPSALPSTPVIHFLPLLLSSVDRVTLFAIAANGTILPNCFTSQQWRFKMILHENNDIQLLVLEVSPLGDALYTLAIHPLTSGTSYFTPAISADLTVTATSASVLTTSSAILFGWASTYGSPPVPFQLPQVSLLLTGAAVLQSVNPAYWQFADIGKTIVIGELGSIIITSIVSETVATGYLVCLIDKQAANTTVSFASNAWTVYDLQGIASYSSHVSQSLAVQVTTPMLSTAATSTALVTLNQAGVFAFSKEHIGLVLTWANYTATIVQVITSLQVKVQGFTALIDEMYSADQWQLRILGSSNDMINGRISFRKRWGSFSDQCRWSEFERDDDEKLHYLLDDNDSTNTTFHIKSSVLSDVPDTTKLFDYSKLAVMFTNRYMLSVTVNDAYFHGMRRHDLSLNMASQIKTGTTTISVRPKVMSLLCGEQASTFKVKVGCDPSLQLILNLRDANGVPQTVLDLSEVPDIAATRQLPVNYRPPSAVGRAVPTTSNIYNGAPDEPRYNDRFKAAKKTGIYKKCLNKSDRASCGCLRREYQSFMVEDSDCINATLQVMYNDAFTLSFHIAQLGRDVRNLDVPFYIKELNNRTDWCINDCTRQLEETKVIVSPYSNTTIRWQGGELYHFRINASIGKSCYVATDLPIYVENAPTRASIQHSIKAITAIVFALWLLSIYLWYSYKQA